MVGRSPTSNTRATPPKRGAIAPRDPRPAAALPAVLLKHGQRLPAAPRARRSSGKRATGTFLIPHHPPGRRAHSRPPGRTPPVPQSSGATGKPLGPSSRQGQSDRVTRHWRVPCRSSCRPNLSRAPDLIRGLCRRRGPGSGPGRGGGGQNLHNPPQPGRFTPLIDFPTGYPQGKSRTYPPESSSHPSETACATHPAPASLSLPHRIARHRTGATASGLFGREGRMQVRIGTSGRTDERRCGRSMTQTSAGKRSAWLRGVFGPFVATAGSKPLDAGSPATGGPIRKASGGSQDPCKDRVRAPGAFSDSP